MTRRAFSLASALVGAALLFAVGCEKKPDAPKGPGLGARPNNVGTMSHSTPTGSERDSEKKETKPAGTAASSPTKPTASLESGSGDLGDADFGQEKRLSS